MKRSKFKGAEMTRPAEAANNARRITPSAFRVAKNMGTRMMLGATVSVVLLLLSITSPILSGCGETKQPVADTPKEKPNRAIDVSQPPLPPTEVKTVEPKTTKTAEKKDKTATGNESLILENHADDAGLSSPITGINSVGLGAAKTMQAQSGRGIRVERSTSPIIYADETKVDWNTEEYGRLYENEFLSPKTNPLSTFSIDVDKASYSNVRRFIRANQMPYKDAVRIEELVNYFAYNYEQPKDEHPFSITTEMSSCPWNEKHQLVHIGLQGKKISMEKLPPSNLVFLIDVSGSMSGANKLPLVKAAMSLLTQELREEDRVAMVVYAGAAGVVLPPTSGKNKKGILSALQNLEAGGSTAGGEGIELAYKVAKQNFIEGGNNRVILCSDGDFNVGASSESELVRMIEKKREQGIFLTVLGFGMGNYKDAKMEQLADKGNGNYAYIDNIMEAKKTLVSEFGGTLFTIAKDVKIQVEFNPAKVKSYRLVGYENRMLKKEDFNDDKKDAGEIGSGHGVTALYEIELGDGTKGDGKVDPLKYQSNDAKPVASSELMTVKFRYKKPDGEKSVLLEKTLNGESVALQQTSDNFRFAAAVAEFGLLLRESEHKGKSSYAQALELAKNAKGADKEGYRAEFIDLVQRAELLSKSLVKDETPKLHNRD